VKIISLVINITDIEDGLALEMSEVVSDIIKVSRGIVEKGGKVIIQREYTNSPPDLLVEYTKVEELDIWKEKLNIVQEKLGRKAIE
jgi:hypothetical protein